MAPSVIEHSSLTRSILRAYSLTVRAVVRMKTVYGLFCEDGTKWILKPAPSYESAARLRAVSALADCCREQGLILAGPVPCTSGEWFVRWQGERWYLQPWLAGRHVQFGEHAERLAAAKSLAQLHGITRPSAPAFAYLFPTAPLIRRLTSKQSALQAVWPDACAALPGLRRHQQMVFEGAQTAIEAASRLTKAEDGTSLVFCHRDLAPHNLLLVNERHLSVCLIDFDRAGFDTPYLDLLQLCNHSLYFAQPEADLFRELLEVYSNTPGAPFSPGSLRSLLSFPDVLIRSVCEWAQAGFTGRGGWKVKVALKRELHRTTLTARLG